MNILTDHFNRAQLIKQLPLFQSLNIIDVQKIAAKSRLAEYRKGDVICRAGQSAKSFQCLISGRILGYVPQSDGSKDDVEFIRRGKPFGLAALLGQEDYVANFEAINDSTVLEIDGDDFANLLKSVPRLGVELSQMLSERIRYSRRAVKSTRESTIISVYAPLSGAGSSTYALNLARHLKRESQKTVIVVSLLTQEMAQETMTSGGQPQDASPQWQRVTVDLSKIVGEEEQIRSAITRNAEMFDVLPVSFDQHDAALVEKMSDFVTTLAHDYAFVVVDLPNHIDHLVFKTLSQSDIVHLLTTDDKANLKSTRDVVYRLEEDLKENFDQDKINVILSGRNASCYLSFEEINAAIDYDIYVQLPHLDVEHLADEMRLPVLQMHFPSAESDYARELRKIARRISGVQVGLVLGGGAALGVAHIGVLRVLEQNNIPVDVIVGSSMGALIGALYAVGKNPDELETIAREFEQPRKMLKLFDPTLPIAGIIRGGLIRRWLKTRGLEDKTFYGTRMPLKIVAYDLIRREELMIHSGSLADAVRKSIAIPGIIHPIKEGDRVIIDGGVLNPLPTNVLAELGVSKIIAVNVLQSPQHVCQGFEEESARLREAAKVSFRKSPWHYLRFRVAKLFNKLFTPHIPDIIVRTLQASEYVIAKESAKRADVNIHPDLSGIQWFELYQVDTLIARGEAATQAQISQIQALLKE